MKVKIRVSQKQKNLEGFVQSLTNILTQYWGLPPEVRNDPTSQHILNQILEASGLSPASLGGLTRGISAPQQIPEPAMGPVQERKEALV